DLKWTTQFEAAEQKVNLEPLPFGPGPQVPPLSDREVLRLVQEYVEQTDSRSREAFLKDPPESEDQKHEMAMDAGMGQQILRNRDDPRADEWIYNIGRKILRTAGLSIEDESIPHAELAEFVRSGLLELDRRRLARLDDDHGRAFFDQRFDPHRPPDLTFGELTNQYLRMTAEEASANGTSQKWVDKQRSA